MRFFVVHLADVGDVRWPTDNVTDGSWKQWNDRFKSTWLTLNVSLSLCKFFQPVHGSLPYLVLAGNHRLASCVGRFSSLSSGPYILFINKLMIFMGTRYSCPFTL